MGMEAVIQRPKLIPDGMPSIDALVAEVRAARAQLGKHGLGVVLGHGDCKPSNVIADGDTAETVTLIDFELSGPNFRGFDLMKIFRTAEGPNENCMRYFLRCYAEAVDGHVTEEIVSELMTEAFMF